MALHFQRPADSAATTGEFPQAPQPDLNERRILVLHSRDALPLGGPDPADLASASGLGPDVESSARDVARALCSRGHFVEVKGIDRDGIGELVQQLRQDPPDLVFNLVGSLATNAREEIFVPSLLELLGVPYTGSSALTLGLCAQKQHARQLLNAAELATPPAALLTTEPQPRAADLQAVAHLTRPLLAQPAAKIAVPGTAVGPIVYEDDVLLAQLAALRDAYHQPILVEQAIAGRSLQVSFLGGEVPRLLPVAELESGAPERSPPAQGTRGSRGATAKPRPEYVHAAPMPRAVLARIEQLAQDCFLTLALTDYGRCDIRLSQDGTPYILAVHPNCDLAEGGDYAQAGRRGGLSYELLIEQIAISALLRHAQGVRTAASHAYRDSA